MIKIDEQFKSIIPPLTDDEFSRLKESVLKEGVRDKIVLWDDTIIDGHNRYKIATENNIPFETTSMEFESREHALNWMIANQLGRRNLNPNQIAYLRGKRYECEKKIQGAPVGNNNAGKQSGKDCHFELPYKTGLRLADEYGISERLIRYDESFAKAVDILPNPIKDNVLIGESKMAKTDAEIILKMPKPIQKKFIAEVEQGTPIKEAIKKVDPEQKRKEEDERIRRDLEREREYREKTKFDPHSRKFNDATSGTKKQLLDNISRLPDDVEIWVFYNKDKAYEARITINTHTNLKID